MKENYQLVLDQTLERLLTENKRPSLLLHACCAPCSSYVLEYLASRFDITLLFYNPNISPASEYSARLSELHRLVDEMGLSSEVHFKECRYDPESFYQMAQGLEELPEGGERCFRCYELRLEEAAVCASSGGFDYFTTTLSISPHKNAERLNSIGASLSKKYGVNYLFSDFKKKNGYKRSCELSVAYELYRQDYCGCIYSKRSAELRKNKAEEVLGN